MAETTDLKSVQSGFESQGGDFVRKMMKKCLEELMNHTVYDYVHRLDAIDHETTLCKLSVPENSTIFMASIKDKDITCPKCLQRMNSQDLDESQADAPRPEVNEIPQDIYSALEKERSVVYGDPFLSHQAIGLAWEGIFRNRYHLFSSLTQEYNGADAFKPGKLFPADLVAEMLAAFKIIRLARPIYHKDSGDDAIVYIKFDQRFREDKKKCQPSKKGR